MLEFLLAPLRYGFMLRGMLASVLVGIICAVLGTYVVLRGMAFFGDALAHAILPGIAAGYLVQGGDRGPLFWWALGTAVVTALGIGTLSRRARVKEDTAIGILFAGMFALGIALISSVRNSTTDLAHFLFGDVLGVSVPDLVRTAIFGVVILAFVVLLYKEFLVISFDPTLASTLRLPGGLLEILLLILLAVAVVVSLQTVGVALVVAMLVTPAATASLVTRRMHIMMMVSASIGVASSLIGLYLSYYMNIASGAAIVLVATAIFLVTLAIAPTRGRARKSRTSGAKP